MGFIKVFLFIITLLLLLIFYLLKKKSDYWSRQKSIACLKHVPLIGNFSDYVLQKLPLGKMTQKLCRQFPDEPMIGAFCLTEPVLLLQDPELIKLVFVKDFYYFCSRELGDYIHKEIMAMNLVRNCGDHWKVLRQNLTPLFSSSKMKNMFHLIEQCTLELENLVAKEQSKSEVLEVRSLMARYTMDCICACAFGINSNAMANNNEKNMFQKIGEGIFEVSTWRACKIVLRKYWPGFFYACGLRLFAKTQYEVFDKILKGVFESRNYEPTARQDLVDLILVLKKSKYISGESIKSFLHSEDSKISIKVDSEFLVAQCLLFFGAGFETSASTLSFTLYELAKNKRSQEKATEEVDTYVKSKEKLQYDCVTSLQYLDQCVDEALRLHPILPVITREVYEKYTFPNGTTVDKGVRVHLPVYHMHHNPKYFPEPEEFRPERFSPKERQNIKPQTYFPFGEGPRICIGQRFAKMQVIAGLFTILQNYRLELAEGMPKTMNYNPKSIISISESGINLKFIPRNDKKEFGKNM